MSGPEPLNKAARAQCRESRDAFYQCVREQAGYEFTADTAVPAKCKNLRAAFEAKCPLSWVQHFDQQQDAAVRRARQLHTSIQGTATSAAGGLAGKAQR